MPALTVSSSVAFHPNAFQTSIVQTSLLSSPSQQESTFKNNRKPSSTISTSMAEIRPPARKRRKCEFGGCLKTAQGCTKLCIAHGGGRRCAHEGCTKSAQGKAFCTSHGGGRRCKVDGCTKAAQGTTPLCIAHGGGCRCQFPDCTKSAQGCTPFCAAHGGGRRCIVPQCSKLSQSNTTLCKLHGVTLKDLSSTSNLQQHLPTSCSNMFQSNGTLSKHHSNDDPLCSPVLPIETPIKLSVLTKSTDLRLTLPENIGAAKQNDIQNVPESQLRPRNLIISAPHTTNMMPSFHQHMQHLGLVKTAPQHLQGSSQATSNPIFSRGIPSKRSSHENLTSLEVKETKGFQQYTRSTSAQIGSSCSFSDCVKSSQEFSSFCLAHDGRASEYFDHQISIQKFMSTVNPAAFRTFNTTRSASAPLNQSSSTTFQSGQPNVAKPMHARDTTTFGFSSISSVHHDEKPMFLPHPDNAHEADAQEACPSKSPQSREVFQAISCPGISSQNCASYYKRCNFDGCHQNVQGMTNFCKLHFKSLFRVVEAAETETSVRIR